jgi:hypothetical protein
MPTSTSTTGVSTSTTSYFETDDEDLWDGEGSGEDVEGSGNGYSEFPDVISTELEKQKYRQDFYDYHGFDIEQLDSTCLQTFVPATQILHADIGKRFH